MPPLPPLWRLPWILHIIVSWLSTFTIHIESPDGAAQVRRNENVNDSNDSKYLSKIVETWSIDWPRWKKVIVA